MPFAIILARPSQPPCGTQVREQSAINTGDCANLQERKALYLHA
jgi:hypothetical protein